MSSGNGDLYYANEKISSAIYILATSHGTLQRRLLEAWSHQGHHAMPMGPSQAGLPMSDELVERVKAFNERLSSAPAVGDEGTFAATILALNDDDATEAARELLDIGSHIESELRDQ